MNEVIGDKAKVEADFAQAKKLGFKEKGPKHGQQGAFAGLLRNRLRRCA